MNRPEAPSEVRAEAVALAYNANASAPTVVAKGRGLIAAEIIARAKEAGVYVHESPELVALLMQVDLDARIPPELYVAVAELLAWLYSLEQGAQKTTAPKTGAAQAV
ncbi:MAG: EscU/YscU/HrcU family type III secretion system export apparatus switch protein [Proteobacteria bacterium]|nr:EscU/YscU/HrcU family type III secretion system export apparatus switch protein [Pseudomonadota bacterium]RTL29047.1 MAG: flagellar protein [Rhodocyclaceae bacterium]